MLDRPLSPPVAPVPQRVTELPSGFGGAGASLDTGMMGLPSVESRFAPYGVPARGGVREVGVEAPDAAPKDLLLAPFLDLSPKRFWGP